MKIAAYIGGLLGLALLIALVIHADFAAMVRTLEFAGWKLLWLVPYRTLFFLMYAIGWLYLLRPYDPQRRAGLGYLFWVSTVRDAIDRMLPVASVGGSIAGVRLLRWRGLGTIPASTTVIVEILLTLIVAYLFTALGLVLLLDLSAPGPQYRRLLLGFLLSLPVPAVTVLLLRSGSVFRRLHSLLHPFLGERATSETAASLDRELRVCLHRSGALMLAGGLQLVAFILGAFEVWFAMRLFGHPVGVSVALVMESVTQAIRQMAFVIPAGLGVQEAGLVLFGHTLGISSELALAVSMAKRVREVLWGLPSLLSWQWLEGRRLHGLMRTPS
jgi:putative membrane protein